MAVFKGNFRWACPLCDREWFMEVDANRCCPWGIYPLTPINWKADKLDGCTCGGIGNTGSHRPPCQWAPQRKKVTNGD